MTTISPPIPAASGAFMRHWPVGLLTLIVIALTADASAQGSGATLWQSPATIAAAARAAVAPHSADVEAVVIDERIRLKQCASALDTDITRSLQRGRATVAVSCRGPQPWRLFVPVRTRDEVPVLVNKRALQPGDVVSAADVTTERRPIATLPYDYATDITQVVGLTVRRTQPAGSVLALAALDYPQVVERGALVTLIAETGSITVKSAGTALEPGRLRQRIRVRSASGRIIEGTAEAPGQVRVGSKAGAG